MPIEQMIVTERDGGKGVNPAQSRGYQVAARSPGLDDKTCGQIKDTCVSLAQTLMLQDAKDKAAEWNTTLSITNAQRQNGYPLPPEILDEFPVVWNYWHIADDTYALAQVRYLGFCRSDPRLGNFLAHALVFSLQDLAPCGFNPMALARSGLLRSTDDGETTSLPAITQLPSVPALPRNQSPLSQSPYREQMIAMLSCLAGSAKSGPPLLLCLADWRQGHTLIEALLDLIPPVARCRTAFCSFANSGHPVKSQGVLVVWKENIAGFSLTPGNYEANAKYQAFNFVDHKYLSIPPSRYASFVASELQTPNSGRLKIHHNLAEELGLTDAADWDRLVAVTQLGESSPNLDMIIEAMHFLAELASDSSIAPKALSLAQPHVQRLVKANNLDCLKTIAPDVASMVNAVAALHAPSPTRTLLDDMKMFVRDALGSGNILMASSLLDACGRASKDILLEALRERLMQPGRLSCLPDDGNRSRLVDLLLDALRCTEAALPQNASPLPNQPLSTPPVVGPAAAAPEAVVPSGCSALPLGPLLIALFRAASEASKVPMVWNAVADAHVKPFFSNRMDPRRREMLDELAKVLPEGSCPQARLWLSVEVLKTRELRGENLYHHLEHIAAAISQESDIPILDEVLQLAKDLLQGHTLIVAIGRMAEKTTGNPLTEDMLYKEYRKQLSDIAESQWHEIRHALSVAGAAKTLCREFMEDILPWEYENNQSAGQLQSWISKVFNNAPAILDAAREETAWLLGAKSEFDVSPLARELLRRQPDNQATPPGHVSLFQAFVLALPIEPMPGEDAQIMASPPKGLSAKAKARLDVLRFLGVVKGRASEPKWSLAEFPSDNPDWHAVSQLEDHDKQAAIECCLDTFKSSGITRYEEAEGLWKMLKVVNDESVPTVTQAVCYLLEGRDAVTAVQVAMALGQHVLTNSRDSRMWEDVFRGVAASSSFDRHKRALLGQHLDARFCFRNQEYKEGVKRLCVAAGLAQPKWLSWSPAQSLSNSRRTPRSLMEGDSGNVVDYMVGFVKRLFKKPEDPKQDVTGQIRPPQPANPPKAGNDKKNKKKHLDDQKKQ